MRLQPFKLTRNPIVFEFILFCLAAKRHCLITLIFSFKEGLQRHRLFSSRVSPAPPPVREFKHHLNEKNSCLFGMDKTLVNRKTLATSSVDAVIATTGEDPNSMLAISEIDQFLSQVDKLLQNVPTTGERLSRIAKLFPPGHGPCVEAVQETTNCDVDVLQNLKLAIFNIQDSFVNLRKKQDEICREFENEANLIERQMNQQEDVAALADDEEVNGVEASGHARTANFTVIVCSSLCLKWNSIIPCNISRVSSAIPVASRIYFF